MNLEDFIKKIINQLCCVAIKGEENIMAMGQSLADLHELENFVHNLSNKAQHQEESKEEAAENDPMEDDGK